MVLQLLEPRKALNKAFLKIKANREPLECFKVNLIQILNSINEKETEEFHKNLVIDFLKKTYYDPNYSVNTKGRNDLVIHNGKDATTPVAVIIEAKSPSNKSEMITAANLNGKALQELVLYYLRERITHKNTELKHLVVTNIYEWFVFDAQLFNKLFAENKAFVKQFVDFEEGRLSSKKTDFFYNDIAKPFLEALQHTVEFAYFDIRKYDKALRNSDKEDDKPLVALYKLLSPEHLLKLSFANDSNSLDKNFYGELLHIIGLTEIKDGGKKLIQRHKLGDRNPGSLLENAIVQLDSLDKISRLQNAKQYGDTYDEKLFNIALELVITWVNRILFLKLLEAQLITYHKGDRSYSFLNSDLIKDYDNLNSLFFQVLARKPEERIDRVKTLFAKIPYLNSSLFEPTDLEHDTFFIAQLEDNIPLSLLSATVIKDNQGKKNTGGKNTLDYFFSFLDAYDFTSEGGEDIQEENKRLINASVLGLIFEKINGYKDGSFFTPSFITMYMCKETIRRAVVEKFSSLAAEKEGFQSFEDVQAYCYHHYKKEDKAQFNTLINDIKICDPAVGSGHFLVSALNELIVIKKELGVLVDKDGLQLRVDLEVVNDELIVTDEDGILFSYNPNNKESQRIQETLFHEKQTIIENCLFGVDINPNSVKICRLRLWIELLKNSYYRPLTPEGGTASGSATVGVPPLGVRGLETLPNIDINIKCGNSLIARFGLDADLKIALKNSKWNIESYKLAVATYRNADSKEQKREMERLITDIKGNFRTEIGISDPKKVKLKRLNGELFMLTNQTGLFERSKKEQTAWNKSVTALTADIKTVELEIEEIIGNKIYENAFEWRFEFPDVLNDNGDFVGFDVVIGNPPYVTILLGKKQSYDEQEVNFYKKYYNTFEYKGNTYVLFIERANSILKENGVLNYIIPNTLLLADTYSYTRKFLLANTNILELINCDFKVFDEAEIGGTLLLMSKRNKSNNENGIKVFDFKNHFFDNENINIINQSRFLEVKSSKFYIDNISIDLLLKTSKNSKKYGDLVKIYQGVITGDNNKFISSEIIDDRYVKILRGKDINSYSKNFSNNYLLFDKNQLWSNTDEDNFFKEKIISRQTSDTLIGAYDNDKYITLDSTHVHTVKDANFEIKFLLAIFNSNLLRFIYKLMVQEEGRVFAQVKTVVLKELPIKEISKESQQPFIDKVNEILLLKTEDSKTDTQVLEQEIDAMVYELYGLSVEEIAIVEGS
jgi:hypothetical protein